MSSRAWQGTPVRIEWSADSSAGTNSLTLWTGDSVSRVLTVRERLFIVSLTVQSAVAATAVTIFDDRDNDGVIDAGERIFVRSTGASSPVSCFYGENGTPCGLGRTPKVIQTGAGVTDVTGVGYIMGG